MNAIRSFINASIVLFGVAVLFAGSLEAEEVSINYQGLRLNGNLELAEGRSISDGVVLMVHGNMAHYDVEIMRFGQAAYKDNGFNSLAINLSLGVDNRHGMYDCSIPIKYKLSEANNEFEAWLKWLSEMEVENVVMLGHSLSANLVLLHSVEQKNPMVKAMILLAPNTTGFPSSYRRYSETYGVDLYEILARANRLIKAGGESDFMESTDFAFCPRASVTAGSFVDFYRHDSTMWAAHTYLPRSKVPLLVITGSIDDRQPRIREHILPYVDNKTVWHTMIEGAGHFFRDFNIDEAIESSVSFLTSNEYL